MRDFISDKAGGFYTYLVIIIVMFVADISYVVVALTNARFFDLWDSLGYGAGNLQIAGLEAVLRNVGPITIVSLNVGLIILMIVSAWKSGSNETAELEL